MGRELTSPLVSILSSKTHCFINYTKKRKEKKPDQNKRLRLHRNEGYSSAHTKGTKSDEKYQD